MIRSTRLRHYAVYLILFTVFYAGLARAGLLTGGAILAILVLSLAKDVADERHLRAGQSPYGYRGFEHAPSNVAILLLLGAGAAEVPGAVGGLPLAWVAPGLAVVDLAFDLWQDVRADRSRI